MEHDEIINQLIALESTTSPGEWTIRDSPYEHSDDWFVEAPKQEGDAYGIQVLSDEEYATKREDAEFIIKAKNLIRELRIG